MTKQEINSELLSLRSAIDGLLLGLAVKPSRRPRQIKEPMICLTPGKWHKPKSLRKS